MPTDLLKPFRAVAGMFARTGLAKVTPEPMPGESDYYWSRAPFGSRPERIHYRDLPIVSQDDFDDVKGVRAAMTDLSRGYFYSAANLCDAFGTDDRIKGVRDTRVDALASLPLDISGRGKRKKSEKLARQATEEWSSWIADPDLKKIDRAGMDLGLGVGEIIWDTDSAGYWRPRVKAWDTRYVYWRWDTRSFWLITMDGPVEMRPGDGHWILYCPNGYVRGWMGGSVRSLALLFLMRRWAFRDWARHSEVHGLPIKKAITPANAATEDKEKFEYDLRHLGSEGLIRVPQDASGDKFDLQLLEAASQSHEGFKQLIDKCDECIAVSVLGGNLGTSAKTGGSYALGDVQDRIRLDRLESDAKLLGDCLTDQLLKPWAAYNFGDPELAPLVRWSTKAPEDRAATAKTWQSVSASLNGFRSAGMNVDVVAVAKQFKVPLVEGEPTIEPSAPGAPNGDGKQTPADEPGAEKPEESAGEQPKPEDTDADQE